MMMIMQDEFQERKNLSINDIDLSLLRLSSPPSYHSSPVSPPEDISPLKRSSPVSDGSDQPKRRRLSPSQDPIFISSPLFSTYPAPTNPSTLDDPTTLYPNLSTCHACSVSEKQETTPYASKTHHDTETVKMVNDHVKEINHQDTTNYVAYEDEINREETNDDDYEEEEEDFGQGMRIERSGDGFVIRLKCRCKLAFRVLFSDHHLYFKSL